MTLRIRSALRTLIFNAGAVLLLASCGGSSGPPPSALMAPQAAVEAATCLQSSGSDRIGYRFDGGVCTRVFAPMYAPERAVKAAQSPLAHPFFAWRSLLAWAEAAYPEFFRGSVEDGTEREFTYRRYPATGNYISLRTTTWCT